MMAAEREPVNRKSTLSCQYGRESENGKKKDKIYRIYKIIL
jgi:hypothetical protein